MQQLNRQSGSALIYAIVAIALLGILTFTLSKGGGEQGSQKKQTQLISDLSGQINFITSAIQECVINYPNQDTSLDASGWQYNKPFPITPDAPYFNGLTPGPAPAPLAEYIRCPGNPGGNGPNSKNHARIFGASTNKFFPPAPNLFDGWFYVNDSRGVHLNIGTGRSDPYLATALQKLDAKYAPCEADYFDGAVNGGGICPSTYKCFTYWIVRKPAAPPCP